ncbi:hypothetical protein FDP41_004049 [Naegleria fowleri]|uniref:Uncharacterized protein n=1 Tax=Naegleria fowleri TaxID=5763 RepID=A0A6A5BRF0_NAEFO|nr:uncharacterized protein FDP41_004049 [Naegleria fowleri]KAF0976754.1 hypothetical protein FDP41_004049 [Naegleria fowleri]
MSNNNNNLSESSSSKQDTTKKQQNELVSNRVDETRVELQLTSQTPKRKRNTKRIEQAKNVRKKLQQGDEGVVVVDSEKLKSSLSSKEDSFPPSIPNDSSMMVPSTCSSETSTIITAMNNNQEQNSSSRIENTSSSSSSSKIDSLLKEDLSTTERLLTIDVMHKIVRRKIEILNKQQQQECENNNNTTSTDQDSTTFVLGMTKNQIRQRLAIAKQKGLALLPEALIEKLCDIFQIAICYLWTVEEKQQFLVDTFGNNYSTALLDILKRFYIPLENDPILTKQSTFVFLEPEEIDNAEERDRLREEQQQVISAMMASRNTSKDQSKEEYDTSLLELLNKHQEKYKSRQNRFLTGLANPKEFLKDADLFRQQRMKREEAQRKQQQQLLERKKIAHTSTIKVDQLPDNRFTSGIKVKSKKKKK